MSVKDFIPAKLGQNEQQSRPNFMQKSLLLQNWKKRRKKKKNKPWSGITLNYFMKSDTEADGFISFSLKKPLEKLGKIKVELWARGDRRRRRNEAPLICYT